MQFLLWVFLILSWRMTEWVATASYRNGSTTNGKQASVYNNELHDHVTDKAAPQDKELTKPFGERSFDHMWTNGFKDLNDTKRYRLKRKKKLDYGQPCKDKKECIFPAVCGTRDGSPEKKCRKLSGGAYCKNDEECVAKTTCDLWGLCTVDYGKPCTKAYDCTGSWEGTLCLARRGSDVKKCRKPVGGVTCRDDEDCSPEAICDYQKQCRLNRWEGCGKGLCLTGAACTDGTCQCNPEATNPMSLRCDPTPRKVSGSCVILDNVAPCEDSLACCPYGNRCRCVGDFVLNTQDLSCRINAGSPCSTRPNATQCITGASCIKGVCLMDYGELCVGSRGRNCKPGSFCDGMQCQLGASRSCERHGECIAGAHCDGNECTCTGGVTVFKYPNSCEVREGVVGGKCKASGCDDRTARCNQQTGLCECLDGYTPTERRLTCQRRAESSKSNGDVAELSATLFFLTYVLYFSLFLYISPSSVYEADWNTMTSTIT